MTDNNAEIGSAAKNLASLYSECSPEFKTDLRSYANLYASQRVKRNELPPNGYSLFIKMFYAFAEANEGTVDLKSVTYGDVSSLFPDVTTIASAVEAGLLPRVNGADLLIATM